MPHKTWGGCACANSVYQALSCNLGMRLVIVMSPSSHHGLIAVSPSSHHGLIGVPSHLILWSHWGATTSHPMVSLGCHHVSSYGLIGVPPRLILWSHWGATTSHRGLTRVPPRSIVVSLQWPCYYISWSHALIAVSPSHN